MKSFLEKHQELISGVLNGFDRLIIKGTLRYLAHTGGMLDFLHRMGVLLKNFGSYVEQTTLTLKEASIKEANRLNRPLIYLPSSGEDKREIARKIMEEDKIDKGLICVLKSVEPCLSYSVYGNKQNKKLDLKREWRKCLHIYIYIIIGLMKSSDLAVHPFKPGFLLK